MSPKSSVPQAASSDSQVLMSDTSLQSMLVMDVPGRHGWCLTQ